jgi:hypothetical protein
MRCMALMASAQGPSDSSDRSGAEQERAEGELGGSDPVVAPRRCQALAGRSARHRNVVVGRGGEAARRRPRAACPRGPARVAA